ncbi:hypothetical protein GIB67_006286 [Kingdonia uniflora]|uniref:Uncharacterized protein n=1 Tax=Kingdonia uniflora TaxID=39325 RepID=A0A7J7P681_9MAGN|nr:hypothetical protein GIB67_006286 [Kingdonia uniflora]
MAEKSLFQGETLERNLLDTLVSTAIEKDEVATSARAFLETNNGVESYQRLLQMWERLKQPTKNIVALAALVNTLLKDKEHLRINLARAEEEVRVLFEENNILDEENKRLLRQINRERQGSAGKHASSASAKGNKRKSSPRACSSIEMAIDYNGMDSSRLPLSPLQQNSPDSRMHKK